jgi:hypothetical protein
VLKTFVHIGNAIPLNANFLNGWFPAAYFLNTPGDPIYSITDDFKIFNIISLRSVAIISVLILVFLFIRKIYKTHSPDKPGYNIFLIVGFATFIFPFVMTSAHENHLFLATVLFIPVLGKVKNIFVKLSIHILLILQCINLYGFYGYAENKYIINISYTYEKAFVLSLIAVIAFLILLVYFLSSKSVFLTEMKKSIKD